MKKFLLFATALTVVVSGGFAQGKVKIGVAMAVFDDVWLTYVRNSMTNWADSHPDVQLTIVDAKNDSSRQLGQVENFLAQKMDAIVVLPCDTSATGPITKEVTAAGIPLVYVNRQPDNLPPGVIYVGSRSIDAGVFEMTELGKRLHGKGDIVVLMGQLDNEAAINRTAGYKKVIGETYPHIKIVRQQTGNWEREQGRTIMENWLASGIHIDAVASNNDEMAIGASLAIKAAGKGGKILVGGVDASLDGLTAVANGDLACTVFQNPFGQGAGAIQAAYLAVVKKPNPEVVNGIDWVPFEPVTKANYKKYMDMMKAN